jgi:ADP-dependent NAD(P)H-hydrate dehydratase / NAD(P)H-hydrate epimerase
MPTKVRKFWARLVHFARSLVKFVQTLSAMKIFSASQLRSADQYTIAHEPVSSLDLMERAAMACADRLLAWIGQLAPSTVHIFCGPGNNGGDGMVIARRLVTAWPTGSGPRIETYLLGSSDSYSPDLEANFQRLTEETTADFIYLHEPSDFPELASTDLLVDCLFGSGLNRPLIGLAAKLVAHLNQAGAPIAAVDVPSGLSADQGPLGDGPVVRATRTFTFQAPKLSLVFDDFFQYTGEWEVVPIGLDPQFLHEQVAPHSVFVRAMAQAVLRPRPKTAHKGHFGHVLVLAGSHGKIGAAQLAARAGLRGGAGLCTAYVPECGYVPLQTALPEAMVLADPNPTRLTQMPNLALYSTLVVGPGLGQHPDTAQLLRQILTDFRQPVVLDADALNLLADHPNWLGLIPPRSILTPHPKEFARLVGGDLPPLERHRAQLALSAKYQVCMVLKGAYTCTTLPDGRSFFNTSGNPGMATAGTGDVLAGVLGALLAQGYPPEQAAPLGVYLHGRAGDLAAQTYSQPAMLAGDLAEHLGRAFLELQG